MSLKDNYICILHCVLRPEVYAVLVNLYRLNVYSVRLCL